MDIGGGHVDIESFYRFRIILIASVHNWLLLLLSQHKKIIIELLKIKN
jgi:hypothetical protein